VEFLRAHVVQPPTVVEVRTVLSLVAANAAVLAGAVLVAATPSGGATLATSGLTAAPAPVVSPAPVLSPAPLLSVAPSPAPRPVPSLAPSPVAASRPPQPKPAAPPRRSTLRTAYRPYAQVGPVVLHFPGDVVEVVGLHESGHDGAQPQSPLQRERIGLLGSRSRDTNGQGAADIVLDPTRVVRSPVTGTVLRAGTYTLYCDNVDQYLDVEPDARPGWEVKLLHFQGLRVAEGDRVQAGVTVVGSGARVLPFASQVDKHTVAPHWPHVHVEVVDPSVPDRPSSGSCD